MYIIGGIYREATTNTIVFMNNDKEVISIIECKNDFLNHIVRNMLNTKLLIENEDGSYVYFEYLKSCNLKYMAKTYEEIKEMSKESISEDKLIAIKEQLNKLKNGT